VLDQFGRNLTKLAREGKLDPVIGREKEIERVMQVLSRRTKNNPVLIGEPGVGKTAVVEGLAQRIVKGEVPETLKDKQLYTLDLGALVAGSQVPRRLRGAPEEGAEGDPHPRRHHPVHRRAPHLVGAGAAEGAIDAASILKPMLARGELQTIGATTLDEYRKYLEKDAALERRFQPIQVAEPTSRTPSRSSRACATATRRTTASRSPTRRSSPRRPGRPLHQRPLPARQGDRPHRRGRLAHAHPPMTAPPDLREFDERDRRDVRREKEPRSTRRTSRRPRRCATARSKLLAREARARERVEGRRLDVVAEVDEERSPRSLAMWTGIPVFKLTEEETAEAAAHGGRAAQARHRPGEAIKSPSRRRSAAPAPA
jgi:ATP-dependent Clp protease ATP-binding subunit ClpC